MIAAFRYSLITLFFSAAIASAGGGKYTIKEGKQAPPKELDATIQKLLGEQTVELHQNGKKVAELWFCKTIPGNVPADKAKDGLKYRELPESTIFGAVQFYSDWTDYRKQKMKAGVYTMRLAFQPQDGDHMGTSPFPEFLLLIASKFDPKAGSLPTKEMAERSMASINTAHPAVFLLFPGKKGGKTELVAKEDDHWILHTQRDVSTADNKTASLDIALTIVGHASE